MNIKNKKNKENSEELTITNISLPNKDEMKVHILGGVYQTSIGCNCMAIINDLGEIILIDIGIMFGTPEIDGYKYVLPDMNFIQHNIEKIKGIFFTHTHEDHVGAYKHLIKFVDKIIPSYCSKFGKSFMSIEIENEISDKNICKQLIDNINIIEDGEKIEIGNFVVKPISTIHSAPFSFMFHISTKNEKYSILHTGDFRMDFYLDNEISRSINGFTNFKALAELGEKKQVDCLFIDSTRSSENGIGVSEKEILFTIEKLLKQHIENRIILTCFGSSTSRLLSIAEMAINNFKRKVFAMGYSMKKALFAAEKDNLLRKEVIFFGNQNLKSFQDSEILILISGSQGDIGSALDQLVNDTHPTMNLSEDDIIIFSSAIIPGNETQVYNLLQKLLDKNLTVYHPEITPNLKLHGTGHAYKLDTMCLLNLVKPKNFIPIHGSGMQLYHNKKNALDYGLSNENVFIIKNGYTVNIADKIEIKEGESKKYLLDENGSIINIADIKKRKNIMKTGMINLTLQKIENNILVKKYNSQYTSELFKNIDIKVLEKFIQNKWKEENFETSNTVMYKISRYALTKTSGCMRNTLPELKVNIQKK